MTSAFFWGEVRDWIAMERREAAILNFQRLKVMVLLLARFWTEVNQSEDLVAYCTGLTLTHAVYPRYMLINSVLCYTSAFHILSIALLFILSSSFLYL